MDLMKRFLDNRVVFLVALVWLVLWIGAHVWPASWWMEVDYIVAECEASGCAVYLDVDRTIHRPFVGTFVVNVRERMYDSQGEAHWVVVCAASGGGDYFPGAALPDPVTLEWWTAGACSSLHEGVFRVDTVWSWRAWPFPRKSLVIKSNVFLVGEPLQKFIK